jgi:hypothetical protein
MMPRDVRLTVTYFLGATLLTVLIVFQGQRSDEQLTASIRKLLEIEIEGLSEDFCETINDMHRVRGFEVIDCKNRTVKLDQLRVSEAKEKAE